MKKIIKILSLVTSISLLNTGCIFFNAQEFKRENGAYIKHYNSCGPVSIQRALGNIHKGKIWYRQPFPRREISQEIQKSGNITRLFLAFFNDEALGITWPREIKEYFKKNGYDVTEVKSLKELNPKKDTAIVLIRGDIISISEWHWACFPVDSNIDSLFGEKTKIVKIFLIKKIN